MIAPQDLTICKKSDGSDFLLGQGTFGAVDSLLDFHCLPAGYAAPLMDRAELITPP